MMYIKITKRCLIAFFLIMGFVCSVFNNVALFAAQVDRNEQFALDHYQKGLKYYLSGKYEQAIEEYKKALELHPEPLMSGTGKELIRNGLAGALSGVHRYDEAIDVLKEAIKLSPNQWHLYLSLAGVYESKGDFDNAEKTYISIRDQGVDPKFDPEYFLGMLYEKKGDLEGAIAFYKKYLALHPGEYVYYLTLSEALEKVHKNSEAADALEKYLEGDLKKLDVNKKSVQEEIKRTEEKIKRLRGSNGTRRAVPDR